MDLATYLRPLRKWLVLFVVLAAGVGGVAAYLQARDTQDTQRASLVLNLPPPVTGQPRELDQLTADFVQNIYAPEVVTAAADASGLPQSSLYAGLSARKTTLIGSGVEVSATGTDPDALKRAVAAAAAENYRVLVTPRLEAAQTLQERLDADYDEAQRTPPGEDAEEQRRRQQVEATALRAASQARTTVLDIQSKIETVDDDASAEAAQLQDLDDRWPIVQTGLTNGGATLFALIALLVAVQMWRTRPSRPARPVAAPTDPDRTKDVPAASAAEAPEADEVVEPARGRMTPGKGKRKSPELAGSTASGSD